IELTVDGDARSAESRLGNPHRVGADALDAERSGKAPGRVDGEHEDAFVLRSRDRHAECGAHRGLADPTATAADHDVERSQEAAEAGRLLSHTPASLGDERVLGGAHASLPLSASATAR